MEMLNNLEFIQNRIGELVIQRREASREIQKKINANLTWLYARKYELLKGGDRYGC